LFITSVTYAFDVILKGSFGGADYKKAVLIFKK